MIYADSFYMGIMLSMKATNSKNLLICAGNNVFYKSRYYSHFVFEIVLFSEDKNNISLVMC